MQFPKRVISYGTFALTLPLRSGPRARRYSLREPNRRKRCPEPRPASAISS